MTTIQILASGGLFTAVGALLGIIIKEVFDVIKAHASRKAEKEDEVGKLNEEIDLLKEEMNASRKERSIICYGLVACLDGLIQNGANGAVTEAKDMLEKHLNKKAHGLDE